MAKPSHVPLTLRNPSPYARDGVVVRAWQPVATLLGGKPKTARVYRELDPGDPETKLQRLRAQVDVLDPDDPERTQLAFGLGGVIGAGDENYTTDNGYVRVQAAAEPDQPPGTAVVEQYFTGVKMRNEYLELWINTDKKWDVGRSGEFYAGSVTYVNLLRHGVDHFVFRSDKLDALDADAWGWDRDPEQRALQIDRIHLVRPPWDERGSFDALPYQHHWHVLQTSQGPVRSTATIRSTPFQYTCKDVDGTERAFDCTVYRTFSLYSGEEFIGDEVWVKAVDTKTGEAQRVWFSASYFSVVNLTIDGEIFRYPNHPGWFTIHSEANEPHQGYAFATDSVATALWRPPLDYPLKGTKAEHRAFSWEVGPTRVAHSFHAFRVKTNRQQLTDFAGLMWYHLAFKRVRATLEGEK